MIKKLLTITLFTISFIANSQSFTAMYPFTAVTSGTAANTGTVDPTPTPTVSGVTFGAFSCVGTFSLTAASSVFAFPNWGGGALNGNDATFTGSLSTSKYYDVSVTPASGSTVTLNSISFKMNRSSTGPRNWAWRSDADAFTNNLTASVGTNTNISVQLGNNFFWSTDTYTTNAQQKGCSVILGGASFTSITNPVNFRLYAWNAEANAGTFRIDTVVFDGSVTLTTGLATLSYDLNTNFNVYPVPNTDGIVYIENKNTLELSSIELIDMFGNVVLISKNEVASKIKLNVADIANGNYFIRINTANNSTTKKVVILK